MSFSDDEIRNASNDNLLSDDHPKTYSYLGLRCSTFELLEQDSKSPFANDSKLDDEEDITLEDPNDKLLSPKQKQNSTSNSNRISDNSQLLSDNSDSLSSGDSSFDFDDEAYFKNPLDKLNSSDSLFDFPSENEFVDESNQNWQMPIYMTSSVADLPPLIENLDFTPCVNSPSVKSRAHSAATKKMRTLKSQLFEDFDMQKSPINSNQKMLRSSSSNETLSPLHRAQFVLQNDNLNDDFHEYLFTNTDSMTQATESILTDSNEDKTILNHFKFDLPDLPDCSDNDSDEIETIDLQYAVDNLLEAFKATVNS